jgi:hypothetical protein
MWDWVNRAKRVSNLLPVLENGLAGFGEHPSRKIPASASTEDTPIPEEPSPASPVLYPLARKR